MRGGFEAMRGAFELGFKWRVLVHIGIDGLADRFYKFFCSLFYLIALEGSSLGCILKISAKDFS